MSNVENFQSAARWKRIVAFAIDTLFLFFLGWMIGVIFKDQLIRFGSLARFVGYLVAGIYYTVTCSYHLHGQTLGKYLAKIQVINVGGGNLSVLKSFLRFNAYGVPYFLNGAFFDYVDPLSIFAQLVGGVLLFTALSDLYLFLFSEPKRTLSDLLCKTVVVPVEATASNPPVLRVHHLVAVSVIGLAVLATNVYFSRLAVDGPMVDVMKTLRAVQVAAKTNRVSVNYNTNTVSSSSGKTITHGYRIQLVNPIHSNPDSTYAREIAEIAYVSSESIKSVNHINVGLVMGVDIGIYSGWFTNNFHYRPDDLKVIK